MSRGGSVRSPHRHLQALEAAWLPAEAGRVRRPSSVAAALPPATGIRCSLLPGFTAGDDSTAPLRMGAAERGLLGALVATGPQHRSDGTDRHRHAAPGRGAPRASRADGQPDRPEPRRDLRPYAGPRATRPGPSSDLAGEPVPDGRRRPQRRSARVGSRPAPPRRRARPTPACASRTGRPCWCRRHRCTPAPTAWRHGTPASTRNATAARTSRSTAHTSGCASTRRSSSRCSTASASPKADGSRSCRRPACGRGTPVRGAGTSSGPGAPHDRHHASSRQRSCVRRRRRRSDTALERRRTSFVGDASEPGDCGACASRGLRRRRARRVARRRSRGAR